MLNEPFALRKRDKSPYHLLPFHSFANHFVSNHNVQVPNLHNRCFRDPFSRFVCQRWRGSRRHHHWWRILPASSDRWWGRRWWRGRWEALATKRVAEVEDTSLSLDKVSVDKDSEIRTLDMHGLPTALDIKDLCHGKLTLSFILLLTSSFIRFGRK